MSDEDLEVVPSIDLKRYAGKWYEIARLPNRFQKGCVNTTATYTLLKDGPIEVLNECGKGKDIDRIKGRAKVADKGNKAKLKVTFFWPFYAPYWVIGLGKDYDWAVVGTPSRKYLWLLSRTPRMEEKLHLSILEDIRSKGYHISNLIRSVHAENE